MQLWLNYESRLYIGEDFRMYKLSITLCFRQSLKLWLSRQQLFLKPSGFNIVNPDSAVVMEACLLSVLLLLGRVSVVTSLNKS